MALASMDVVAKFSPAIAALIHAARRKMRALVPHVVIGYGPSEKASLAIFSLAAQAKGLPDPQGILRGSGNVVRNIRLESVATLDRPEVRELMRVALEDAAHHLMIKSVSAKQRPRRISAAKKTSIK